MIKPNEDLQVVAFCPGPMIIFEQSLSLQERGWLGTLAVDYYCDLSKPPHSFLPEGRIKKYLRKRYYPSLSAKRTRTRLLPSIITKIAISKTRSSKNRSRWVFWNNAQFDRWVASNLPKFGNLVYGYESSSVFTFRRATKLGLPCVLDQPIACAEKALSLLNEEKTLFPELADTLRYNWFPEDELERRREERQLAKAIICASTFTKQSLIETGVDPDKIFVEPYGVDQTVFAPSQIKFPRFSVIWASAYSQTKGIGYLLKALTRKPLPDIELVLAGYPIGTDAVALYEDKVRVRRLGQVSHDELGQVMARCHVHVFPTLLEGFGRNIIEAMASGLPVITTPNCAGPDLIEDGVSGFIIPIRDVDAICEKLIWVHDNPEAAQEMGLRARERVSSLTKTDYRRRFANRIQSVWQRTGRAENVTSYS